MNARLALSSAPPLSSMQSEIALFLDFDGTLVELAAGPDAIKPVPDLAKRLMLLAGRIGGRCAIVSGRGIADIESHIGRLTIAMAGSHGSDIRAADGQTLGAGPAGLPSEIEDRLRAFAAETGLAFEQKPHGGAIHYRSHPELGAMAHEFAEELAREHGWAAQSGKCVVELVARDANKGAAVRALMETPAFCGAMPVFIGDDLTDEKGFATCADLGGFGILVGNRSDTAARHSLDDVDAVHSWLEF